MASALEFAGVAMKARLLRAHALSRTGASDAAAAAMRELVPLLATVQPADLYFGQAWWLAAQVFEASGDGDQALMALAHGAQWVRRVACRTCPKNSATASCSAIRPIGPCSPPPTGVSRAEVAVTAQ